jgi:hypothetical protein
MIQKIQTALVLIGFMTVSVTTSFANATAPISASATLSSTISSSLKVPSKLTSRIAITKEIKDFLDRDFRSRYPVAAPLKTDVVQADVQMYTIFQVPNGFGGFDQRHSFRIVAQHADRTLVTIDVNVYERAEFEPDQDPILLETFRVVGWVR